jgi:hypothetical protein
MEGAGSQGQQAQSAISRESPLPVPETPVKFFIRVHNETLSVAMSVCNPDRSPVGINR